MSNRWFVFWCINQHPPLLFLFSILQDQWQPCSPLLHLWDTLGQNFSISLWPCVQTLAPLRTRILSCPKLRGRCCCFVSGGNCWPSRSQRLKRSGGRGFIPKMQSRRANSSSWHYWIKKGDTNSWRAKGVGTNSLVCLSVFSVEKVNLVASTPPRQWV